MGVVSLLFLASLAASCKPPTRLSVDVKCPRREDESRSAAACASPSALSQRPRSSSIDEPNFWTLPHTFRLAVINDGRLDGPANLVNRLSLWMESANAEFGIVSEGYCFQGRCRTPIGKYLFTNPEDKTSAEGGGVGLMWRSPENSEFKESVEDVIHDTRTPGYSMSSLTFRKALIMVGLYLNPLSEHRSLSVVLELAPTLAHITGSGPAIIAGDMNAKSGTVKRQVIDMMMASLGFRLLNPGHLTFRAESTGYDLDLIYGNGEIEEISVSQHPRIRSGDHDRLVLQFRVNKRSFTACSSSPPSRRQAVSPASILTPPYTPPSASSSASQRPTVIANTISRKLPPREIMKVLEHGGSFEVSLRRLMILDRPRWGYTLKRRRTILLLNAGEDPENPPWMGEYPGTIEKHDAAMSALVFSEPNHPHKPNEQPACNQLSPEDIHFLELDNVQLIDDVLEELQTMPDQHRIQLRFFTHVLEIARPQWTTKISRIISSFSISGKSVEPLLSPVVERILLRKLYTLGLNLIDDSIVALRLRLLIESVKDTDDIYICTLNFSTAVRKSSFFQTIREPVIEALVNFGLPMNVAKFVFEYAAASDPKSHLRKLIQLVYFTKVVDGLMQVGGSEKVIDDSFVWTEGVVLVSDSIEDLHRKVSLFEEASSPLTIPDVSLMNLPNAFVVWLRLSDGREVPVSESMIGPCGLRFEMFKTRAVIQNTPKFESGLEIFNQWFKHNLHIPQKSEVTQADFVNAMRTHIVPKALKGTELTLSSIEHFNSNWALMIGYITDSSTQEPSELEMIMAVGLTSHPSFVFMTNLVKFIWLSLHSPEYGDSFDISIAESMKSARKARRYFRLVADILGKIGLSLEHVRMCPDVATAMEHAQIRFAGFVASDVLPSACVAQGVPKGMCPDQAGLLSSGIKAVQIFGRRKRIRLDLDPIKWVL